MAVGALAFQAGSSRLLLLMPVACLKPRSAHFAAPGSGAVVMPPVAVGLAHRLGSACALSSTTDRMNIARPIAQNMAVRAKTPAQKPAIRRIRLGQLGGGM